VIVFGDSDGGLDFSLDSMQGHSISTQSILHEEVLRPLRGIIVYRICIVVGWIRRGKCIVQIAWQGVVYIHLVEIYLSTVIRHRAMPRSVIKLLRGAEKTLFLLFISSLFLHSRSTFWGHMPKRDKKLVVLVWCRAYPTGWLSTF
jgi:hypothetical protein